MAGLLQGAVVLPVLRVESAGLPVGVGEPDARCDGRNPARLGWKVGGEMIGHCPRCGTRTNVSPCYNCGDRIPNEQGEQRCQAVAGNGEGKVPTTAPACASESPGSNTAAGAAWSLVAWPRTTGEGEEYLALPGQYETRAGAELAAEVAARIQKRTVMVVKRL